MRGAGKADLNTSGVLAPKPQGSRLQRRAPVIVQEYRETVWTAAAGEAVLDEAAGVSRLRRKVVTR